MMRRGRPVQPQTFDLGGRIGYMTDDKCIREHMPCTHLIKRNGVHVLCIVPLPEALRNSRSWMDLEYWVME